MRQYRKKLPKLEIEIQKSLNTYKDSKFNKFTKEKLQIIEKIVSETGLLKATA